MEDATGHLVQDAFQEFDKPAFILITTLLTSEGRLLEGEGMVKHIEKLAGPDITMFGGMAGDAILGGAFEDVVDMTCFAGNGGMCTSQGE